MFEIIIVILVLVVVVSYYKSLTSDQKKVQGELAKDGITVATFATAKIIKEVVKATASSGAVAAKYVQDNHQEVLNSAKREMDLAKSQHGNSSRKLGLHLGSQATETLGLNSLNEDLVGYLKKPTITPTTVDESK